jgi:hypothetical protein
MNGRRQCKKVKRQVEYFIVFFELFAFFLNSDNKPIQRVIQNKFTPGKGDRMGVC